MVIVIKFVKIIKIIPNNNNINNNNTNNNNDNIINNNNISIIIIKLKSILRNIRLSFLESGILFYFL